MTSCMVKMLKNVPFQALFGENLIKNVKKQLLHNYFTATRKHKVGLTST